MVSDVAAASQTEKSELVIGKADKNALTHVYVVQHGKKNAVKRIDINRATSKDLTEADSMTKHLADAIVSYRERHGRFKSLQSLSGVAAYRELSEKQKARLKEQVRV